MFQPIERFAMHQTSFSTIIQRSKHPLFTYGLITNRNGKIEGYFTHCHILAYTLHQYERLDDNPETLYDFSKYIAKDFDILNEKQVPSTFPLHTTLLIYSDSKEAVYIDRATFYEQIATAERERADYFERILYAAPNGMVAINNEGMITMFNHAAEKLYDVTSETAIGRFLLDISQSDGLLRVLKNGQGHVEKYAVNDQWFLAYREPIYNGKQLIGAISVFDDISKMEVMTSELTMYKSLVQENDALMTHSEHGVGILDHKGTVLRENPQFHELYVALLYSEQQRTQFFETLSHVIASKKKTYTELFHLEDGRTLNIRFAPIEADQQQRVIIRIRDDTENYRFNVKSERLRNSVHHYFSIPYSEQVVAKTEMMQDALHKARRAAKGSAPVLILGEPGSGRSLIASEIVKHGEREKELFIEIDCMRESRKRLEHLIFAKKYYDYYFIQVFKNGTLYFKNIDYLPLDMQKRLAQLIAHQSEREAANLEILNARLIASMQRQIDFKHFDEQLFYLLNAISIELPTLPERIEELRIIFSEQLHIFNEKYQRTLFLTEAAYDFLINYALTHSLAQAKELFIQKAYEATGQVLDMPQFSTSMNDISQPIVIHELLPMKDAVELVEKELLRIASAQPISYRQIAKQLDVNPSTIVRKMKKYDL